MSNTVSSVTIGMVLFPNLTQLDLTGPYEVFSRLPGVRLLLLADSLTPVRSENGLAVLPDTSFADAPTLDVICVPGGRGVQAAMQDEKFLRFLQEHGNQARYVTSVCTGSLLLAAAGLLDGYRATTHWLSLDLLALFGVEMLEERVVIDRNRITGGGVTAGIDFALVIAAELFGEGVAREIQLMMEYDPAPPFDSGSPRKASRQLVEEVREKRREIGENRRQAILEMRKKRVK
jgi:cyclohexyl-isocyanide hydratase